MIGLGRFSSYRSVQMGVIGKKKGEGKGGDPPSANAHTLRRCNWEGGGKRRGEGKKGRGREATACSRGH